MDLKNGVCEKTCVFISKGSTTIIGPRIASECLNCKEFADNLKKHPRAYTEREAKAIGLSMTIDHCLELLLKHAKGKNCSIDLKISPIE